MLAAFAAWTGLGAGWSESSERSIAELGRVAAYLGVLVLALSIQGRDSLRRAVCGVGAAIALVGVLALLSRLHPSWFPDRESAAFIGEVGRRLGYPLNYWNGLAALIAIGLPLLVWIAASARHLAARAAAAAAVPALALAAYFTLSRGGAVEIAVALAALFALHPRRLTLVPALVLTGAASILLILLGAARGELADGLATAAARDQGDELLVLTVIVCALVGAAGFALGRAERRGLLPEISIRRRSAAVVAGAVAVAAVVVALAAGAPAELSDAWEDFKDPAGPADVAERFESAGGNGRYQYWTAMVDAAEAEPLTGIGAGTFEFWWAREGTRTGFVRDAHSLYFEALGELGIVGLLLIGGLVAFVLATGIVRALRAPPTESGGGGAEPVDSDDREGAVAPPAVDRVADEHRSLIAAATAGALAFAVAVALDWVWDVFAISAAFLILAAAILGSADPRLRTPASGAGASRAGIPTRVGLAVLAIAGLVAVAIPLAGAASVRESKTEVSAGELDEALESARSAANVQPYAATPRLQEALVLELLGELDAAAAAAREATEAESTNWRTWQVLSRIEAERGSVADSIADYRRARSLNPRSPLFAP